MSIALRNQPSRSAPPGLPSRRALMLGAGLLPLTLAGCGSPETISTEAE